MTKEQIMIDDVDVSECEFYINSKNLEFNCKQTPQSYFCKNKPNCYYKQLKRKEQEYNRLSNLITSTKAYELTCLNCRDAILTAPTISGRTKFSQIEVEETSLKMIIKQLNQLEAENKKLKELVKTKIEDLCDSCGASSMMPMPCKVYEQALQEIKKIAKNAEEQCAIPENYFKRNNVSWKQHQLKGLTCKFKQILQKCEVIDD